MLDILDIEVKDIALYNTVKQEKYRKLHLFAIVCTIVSAIAIITFSVISILLGNGAYYYISQNNALFTLMVSAVISALLSVFLWIRYFMHVNYCYLYKYNKRLEYYRG